ncbi:hypothetical protein EYC80_005563 [Monilinia laxa]|uniref:Transcription elongation factor SPT5 n=1 Tax=Monilinia laxa TaxID=61186 RepID=A0A5N6KEJ9_MONLA|nr:hypothetical protein EYC80_005563 [Monilinia laxa]
MSTSNLLNNSFDDSDEEDDNFNPQPADLSDNEDEGHHRGSAQRNEASRHQVGDDDGSEDESAPASGRKNSSGGGADDGEDEDEDEEGDGEDIAGDDDEEDEEEEEDDDEEEITGHRRVTEIWIEDVKWRQVLMRDGGKEKQAEILRQRYANKGRSSRGTGESAVVPKRLLLPSVDDPSIWAVRCKEGKEREAVFSIMKRIEERAGTKEELAITCAFERGGTQSTMKGFIYVEAQRQADILTAMDGLMNVYPRTKMMLVEIKEMPDLLRVTKSPTIEVGAYVRLRRPAKYAGDLAQVIEVTDTGLELRVRYVPRLDYGLHEDTTIVDGKRKRPVAGPRPPQRLFSEAEAKKRHAKHLQGRPDTKIWNYFNEEYVNGYCEKEVKIQALITKDVNPTLEEVTRFASGAEDGTENLDLNALAASLKASTANASYLPGDVIEVYEGEQKGVVGKAVSVTGDIVTMAVSEGALRGQTIEIPIKGLRKRFREGDHVKVIGGSRFRDEVGMVVKIIEDRVTLLSDQGNNEITVFSKDLREASDSGGSGALGKYELWDLVQLDPATVACIIKVDRESLVVLDQNGSNRTVIPSQISNKLEKRRNAVATDRNGAEIKMEDGVKEFGGEGRTGKILHIHRAYLFLKSSELSENAGVFVARTTSVQSVSAKGGRISSNASSSPDLSSMNPAMKLNPKNNGQMLPPKSFGRDKSIGQTVTIRKGPYKGLLGIVKDILQTPMPDGASIDPNGFRGGASGGRGGGASRGRGGFGGATPGPGWDTGAGGRTPMPGGLPERTPGWGRTPHGGGQGGRTPAWKSGATDGGRTPGWANDGSRTVYANDGSRTAYGGGNRTPAWSSGAKTPAYGLSDNFGSRTPAYGGSGNVGDSWGSKTPAYPANNSNDSWNSGPSNNNNWGSAYDAPTPGGPLSAPTPAAMNAPTPGGYSAPTPAAMNAPTPGAYSAPTPAPGYWGAPTPQAMDAPTPGQGYYAGAPTPGAYAAETPAADWQDDGPRYVD